MVAVAKKSIFLDDFFRRFIISRRPSKAFLKPVFSKKSLNCACQKMRLSSLLRCSFISEIKSRYSQILARMFAGDAFVSEARCMRLLDEGELALRGESVEEE